MKRQENWDWVQLILLLVIVKKSATGTLVNFVESITTSQWEIALSQKKYSF